MTGQEREKTGELLQTLAGERTVVVTEHDMEFVRRYSRTVTVLHLGRVILEGSMADVQLDEMVRDVYLGRTDGDLV
jgi:urea transport system ATP-binding protein